MKFINGLMSVLKQRQKLACNDESGAVVKVGEVDNGRI